MLLESLKTVLFAKDKGMLPIENVIVNDCVIVIRNTGIFIMVIVTIALDY